MELCSRAERLRVFPFWQTVHSWQDRAASTRQPECSTSLGGLRAVRSGVSWEDLGICGNQDRRSETRVVKAIPIEVTGFDVAGRFFVETTETLDISETGCAFRLTRRIERGGIVSIKALNTKSDAASSPLMYQIARATSHGSGWTLGAAKLQPRSLWSIAFPDAFPDAVSDAECKKDN